MEQKLLLVLMSCSLYCVIGTLNPYKQIYFVSQPKAFDEAQKYCRENYNDLLTLWDEAEMEEVFAHETFTSAESAWIGLKNTSRNQWRWAVADQEFYKEGEAEYRHWGPKEPTNNAGEFCSVMDDVGDIRDTTCETSRIFICYNGRNNNEQKYIFINVGKPWREAQRHCREFYTELACVRNKDENLQIQKLIPAKQVAYIGLFQDPYVWSDNSMSPFRNWDSGQPDRSGQCVAQQLQDPRRWDDQKCSDPRPFFCYAIRELNQVLRLQVKSDVNVNVNDPVMKASILQEIQQKLISQGMSAQANLQWRQQPDGLVFQKTREKAPASTAVCPQLKEH